MTKSSPARKTKRRAKKAKANGAADPAPLEAQAAPEEEQQPQAQLTEEQLYIQDLFERAKTGKISAEQKVMVEMLAQSEAGIIQASEKANSLERQIYELNVEKQKFLDAINNERGKARGLGEALLEMRPKKKPARKGRAQKPNVEAPSTLQ